MNITGTPSIPSGITFVYDGTDCKLDMSGLSNSDAGGMLDAIITHIFIDYTLTVYAYDLTGDVDGYVCDISYFIAFYRFHMILKSISLQTREF